MFTSSRNSHRKLWSEKRINKEYVDCKKTSQEPIYPTLSEQLIYPAPTAKRFDIFDLIVYTRNVPAAYQPTFLLQSSLSNAQEPLFRSNMVRREFERTRLKRAEGWVKKIDLSMGERKISPPNSGRSKELAHKHTRSWGRNDLFPALWLYKHK